MPALPTTPKGTATSRRILDAATREFSRYGIAGARIDRITAAARTNKAQVYGYFGSKEGLFDAVLADCLGDNEVPFDVDDLPGWAVRLYDQTLGRPDLMRLMGWIRLEQRPAGLVFEGLDLEPKFEAVARAQAEGRLRPGHPADLLSLVVAMAFAWAPNSGTYAASADEPPAVHEHRRALLRDFVQRAISPVA